MDEKMGRPELKVMVAEASRALARLDSERLEELALTCHALNRNLAPSSVVARTALATEAREATKEIAVLARILEATRSNADVLRRLRELRGSRLEYRPQLARPWTLNESSHGND